jgi:hypothetical protein
VAASNKDAQPSDNGVVYTAEFAPLTPMIVDEAESAVTQVLSEEVKDPEIKYTKLTDICDQGHSSLCAAFAFRDLMVNNLSLDNKLKPAIFSLLTHHKREPGKILLHDDLGFFFSNYNYFAIAGETELETENSLPFEPGLFKNFSEIRKGYGFESSNYKIPAGKLPELTLNSDDHEVDGPKSAVILDLDKIALHRTGEKVRIPRFKILRSIITVTSLVREMKALVKNVIQGKAQMIGICSENFHGFSKKLLAKKYPEYQWKDDSDANDDKCNHHAVLVTDAKLDEGGQPVLTIRNSWGTDLSETGSHELNFKQLVSILSRSNNKQLNRPLYSHRMELEKVPDGSEAVHSVTADQFGWVIAAATKDGLYPSGHTVVRNTQNGSEIQCDVVDKVPQNCSGKLIWSNVGYRDIFFTYIGQIKVKEITMTSLSPFQREGIGKTYLWGNTIADGTYKNNYLADGDYVRYFAGGRSTLEKSREHGTFEDGPDDIHLVKGTRTFFNRAHDVIKTETL